MKLSKAEAIRRHRLMWNWIADETIRLKRKVDKLEAFAHFTWNPVRALCWCCEYGRITHNSCSNCIMVWPGSTCVYADHDDENLIPTGLYKLWTYEQDPEKSAALARQIAELPERK